MEAAVKEWTAPELLALANAHWNSSLLQAGVELGLFTSLARSPMTGLELAGLLHCDPRALAMLLAALAACGLLRIEEPAPGLPGAGQEALSDKPVSVVDGLGSTFVAVPAAARYLSANSPDYLGFIIKHHHFLQPSWHRLGEAVRAGAPIHAPAASRGEEEREAFLMGMFNIAVQQAQTVAAALDLSGSSRLLDLGGGPGTYAVYFCRAYPQLRATIFDRPTTAPYAESIVRRFELEGRVDFRGGDFLQDDLPTGYDVVWLSQILHGLPPEDAAAVVRSAVATLAPGGIIAIQEFMLDDSLDGPLFSTQFCLNMLLGTDGGQAYTRSEIAHMLRRAGVAGLCWPEASLPPGCVLVCGTVS